MAAPINDDISNAININGVSQTQSTVEATTSPGEDLTVETNIPTGKTVWFKYTPNFSGPASFNTQGSNYDTTLQVYSINDASQPVSYGNLRELASNDDNGALPLPTGNPSDPGFSSIVNVNVTAGQTYYIQAGDTGPSGGTLTINATPAPCFVTGTKITTWSGEICVEDLKVGDLVVTASGGYRPIHWIGHHEIDGKGRSLLDMHCPVRVRRDAFGPGLPIRDLFLSPGHPVLVGADADHQGGYLVPIMCLINGTSIAREPISAVTYWHVELDSHDILLAEGLPAESYLDWGDRPFFDQGSDHALHNPDFVVPGLAGRCRPVAVDGPTVEAERARLAAQFANKLTAECGWHEGDTLSSFAAFYNM